MKTILAPIDFSAITDRVCETAVALAKAVNGRVVLLHSVPPPVLIAEYGMPLAENIAELTVTAEKTAANELARLQSRLQRNGLEVETEQECGAPAPFILRQARSREADFIVLGSHGHTALYDLLVGSTAHGVISKSPCPVVIVPPKINQPGTRRKSQPAILTER